MKENPIHVYTEIVELLDGIRRDSKNFIECGTCAGHTVLAAKQAGFEKIHSMEIDPIRYYDTLKKFLDAEEPMGNQIFLYLGSSQLILPYILQFIPTDEPSVFFLDAHDHIHGISTYDELLAIKTHILKTHTILIDDIPLYFGDGSQLKEFILTINPNYKFELLDCPIRLANPLPHLSGKGMRLLAYIELM